MLDKLSNHRCRRVGIRILVSTTMIALVAGILYANHSWGGYHWARTSSSFMLDLGDNVGPAWDAYLPVVSRDWSASAVLDTRVVAGRANPKNCRPTSGRVEVCDSNYGNNGWLGVAQIWLSGKHITQGTVKLNDTYFNTAKYDKPEWRQLVVCQEVGHTFGLDHQDETFDNPNLGTCMDYTNNPLGPPSNEHPNKHDYEELSIIYQHIDATTTVGQATGSQAAPPAMNDIELTGPPQWGKLIRTGNGGRTQLYELDFGNGNKVFTFVVWTDEAGKSGKP